MFLETKENRLKADPRIVVVDRIEDIPRIGSPFSGVHGALCPYNPLSQDEIREIAEYMGTRIRLGEDRSLYATHYFNAILAKTLPAPLRRVFDELGDVFRRAVGGGATTRVLRANSCHPQSPHTHDPALTYTFMGTGTVCVNKQGEHYAVPPDHILLLDKKIPHMASQEHSQDNIKLTILIL